MIRPRHRRFSPVFLPVPARRRFDYFPSQRAHADGYCREREQRARRGAAGRR